MKKLNGFIRRQYVRVGVATSTVLAPSFAFAADPTYTSQMSEALEALNISALVSDNALFLAALFALIGVSVGFDYVTRRFRRAAK